MTRFARPFRQSHNPIWRASSARQINIYYNWKTKSRIAVESRPRAYKQRIMGIADSSFYPGKTLSSRKLSPGLSVFLSIAPTPCPAFSLLSCVYLSVSFLFPRERPSRSSGIAGLPRCVLCASQLHPAENILWDV